MFRLVGLSDQYNRLRFALQRFAAIQGGSILREVFLDSGEDGLELRIKAVDFVFPIPFPVHKAAVQKAGQVVGDPALFNAELLNYLVHIVGSFPQQLYD